MKEPKLGPIAKVFLGGILIAVGLGVAASLGALLALPALLFSFDAYVKAAVGIATVILMVEAYNADDLVSAPTCKFGLEAIREDGDTFRSTTHFIAESLNSPPLTESPRAAVRSLARTIESFVETISMAGINRNNIRVRLLLLSFQLKSAAKSPAFLALWQQERSLIAALRLHFNQAFDGIEPTGTSVVDDMYKTIDVALAAVREQ